MRAFGEATVATAMIFVRYLIACLLVTSVVTGSPSVAHAQDRKELIEVTPWLVANKGPQHARGVIFFMRGFNRLSPVVDEFTPAHPFVLTLNARGWDVISVKYRYQRSYPFFPAEKIPGIAQHMSKRAAELRAEGYRKVVFGGQSLGAWSALYGDARKQLSTDALLLLAPAAWGTRIVPTNGNPNPYFPKNRSDFLPLMSAVQSPTLAIFFKNDEFDPGGRGKFTSATLQKKDLPHAVIDEPRGFEGHRAGWLPTFDFAYGRCMERFLREIKTQLCEAEPLNGEDFRAIVKKADLGNREVKTIATPAALAGRRFVVYPARDDVMRVDFASEKQATVLRSGGKHTSQVTGADGKICVAQRCVSIVEWEAGQLLAFDLKTGATDAWWLELKD